VLSDLSELVSVLAEELSELLAALLVTCDACESDDVLLSHDVKHETISAVATITAKIFFFIKLPPFVS
jgi:hypothetical protein